MALIIQNETSQKHDWLSNLKNAIDEMSSEDGFNELVKVKTELEQLIFCQGNKVRGVTEQDHSLQFNMQSDPTIVLTESQAYKDTLLRR